MTHDNPDNRAAETRAADILHRRLRGHVHGRGTYVVLDQQEGAIVVDAVKAKTARKARTGPARDAGKTTRRRGAAPESRRPMIAEAAYYRAQARGFTAGHELEDWLAAEAEIGS